MEKTYSAPVDKLLTYGESKGFINWPNYLELGFTNKHIPELIKMALYQELHDSPTESTEVWAPVHAWRTLGQLKAELSIKPLISIFWRGDEDDWASEELPKVIGMIGPKAIPHLVKYLKKEKYAIIPRNMVVRSIKNIGIQYPESRDECVKILTDILTGYSKNNIEFNSDVIDGLIEMKAVESIEVIKKAYEDDCVDYFFCGDFEDVEIRMGLKHERTKERDYIIEFEKIDEMAEKLDLDKIPKEKKEKIQQVVNTKKIGRNDPCPCGSGKKFKKCCLNK